MRNRITLLALLAAGFLPATLNAVPAKPTPVIKKLPDGSQISICLRGDERFHFYTSQDGYPIIEKQDGYFYYAVSDESSKVAPGSIRATDEAMRSPYELSYVAGDRKSVV